MLKLKSFEMSQDTEMNELLSQYRLAKGASVFVSEGKIVIPYEDGEPMNDEQKAIDLKEKRNIMVLAFETVDHAQSMVDRQIEEVENQIASLSEPIVIKDKKDKEAYDREQQRVAKLKHLKAVLPQFTNQRISNKAEMDRMQVEIDVYTDKIEDLEGEDNKLK